MSPSPRSGLRLERLEARATPAVASVRATLAAGVLTLTGDAADDNVVLQVGPAGATLTPGSGTSVNGLPAGTAVVLPGPVRSLRAALGAGNDRLALGGGDLVLPGAARIDLGAGDDTLDLATGGTIALGALTVVAGDGADAVTVTAGAGPSRVTGAATINGGPGNSSITLQNLTFAGPSGLGVGLRGGGSVAMSSVTVAGSLTLGPAAAPADVVLTDSALGRLVAPWNTGGLDLRLAGTRVAGGVVVRGPGDANLDLGDVTIGGGVTLTGADSRLDGHGAAVAGDIAVAGTASAAVAASGSLAARNLTARSSSGTAAVTADGETAAVAVAGNLTVAGPGGVTINLAGARAGNVNGNLVVAGSPLADTFVLGPGERVHGDLAVNLGPGPSVVRIGGPGDAAVIDGDLTIKTGDGDDAVTLTNVIVNGATRIFTGAGNDVLTVDWAAVFAGAFAADLGAGADSVAFAQTAGAPAPVAFGGLVTVQAGDGDDLLWLGNSAGDLNSRVVLRAAGNVIDGGAGQNLFAAKTQQIELTGVITTLGLPDWADKDA